MKVNVAWLRVLIAASSFVLSTTTSKAETNSATKDEIIAKMLVELPLYVKLGHHASGSRVIKLCISDTEELRGIVKTADSLHSVYTGTYDTQSPETCDIIYTDSPKIARSLLKITRNQPVLLVSNYNAFVDEGGVLGLVESAGKIQIQVNLSAAAEHFLIINPDLLDISERVIQ